MGGEHVSDFYLMTRAAYTKLSAPIARGALKLGLTPDSVTIIGTAGSVLAALTLYPAGHLFIGWLVIWFFVLADMLDGAMARERGGHATLYRSVRPDARAAHGAFAPVSPALMKVHQRLKHELDAQGVFNPGRLFAGL